MTQPPSEPQNHPQSPARKPILSWLVVFVGVLLLLPGRYDWSRNSRALALEGYLASAWMLLLLLPTVFYTCQHLCGRRSARVLTAILAIICVMPYRWLGFGGRAFWSDTFRYSDWLKDPAAPLPGNFWFPAAIGQEPVIPHEFLVFMILIAGGLIGLLFISRGRLTRRWFAEHPAVIVGIAAFALILIESWLHLSMRSPNSYVMHYAELKPVSKASVVYDSSGHPTAQFEMTSQPHGWWHLYLFPDYRGAVNYDYTQYRDCEEVFQGVPLDGPSSVVRRLLTFYFSSQFAYFFNPYYVFMFLNTAIWLAACLAGFALVRRLTNVRVAAVYALFIASGPGFIFYANQPVSYLIANALVIITIYLFERLIVADYQPANRLLFGAIFAAALLTGDLLPLALLFPAYAFARGVPLRRAILSLACAGGVYLLTLGYLAHIAGVPDLTGNLTILSDAVGNSKAGSLDRIYTGTLAFFNNLSTDLISGFLFLPIVPAIVGLAFLRGNSRASVVAAFMLPCVCTIASLQLIGAHLGDWQHAALPRIAYIAYPAVYLLAATALVEGCQILFPRSPRLAAAAPYLFLAAVLAVNNLDVLGAPAIYYDFGVGTTGGFLPFGEPH